MYNPQASFRNILAPIAPPVFLSEYYDKKPLHIPGDVDKFAGLFGWDELSRLLELDNLWTSDNLSLVADGRKLAPEQYCESEDSNQSKGMAPDWDKVESYLEQGSTMVLDKMQTYSSGAHAIAASLRLALGWPVEGNLYCSWKMTPGFEPHFDTMDVFALQFEGEKTWDIYSTRFELPFRADGFYQGYFPREYHDANQGEKEMAVHMKAGDVLYIPKGKYHAALATSDASLHITFGISQLRAVQFVGMIFDALPNDSLFRQPFPSFLDDGEVEAFAADVGDRMAEILKRPTVAQELSDEMRTQAWSSIPAFAFPSRSRQVCYRVQTIGSKVLRRGKKWQLTLGARKVDLSPEDAKMAEWMLLSDAFAVDDLAAAFPVLSATEHASALDRLATAGLIQRL